MRAFEKEARHGTTVAGASGERGGTGGSQAAGALATVSSAHVERAQVVEAGLGGSGGRGDRRAAASGAGSGLSVAASLRGAGDCRPAGSSARGTATTYSREQVGQIIATALERPQRLGLPYASWTLDRLVAYLAEHKGITMKRSRLDEVLLSEGLRWRKQENWFGERVDPDFAAKRGPSNDSTPARPPTASSSASTRWVRKRQRASRAKPSST